MFKKRAVFSLDIYLYTTSGRRTEEREHLIDRGEEEQEEKEGLCTYMWLKEGRIPFRYYARRQRGELRREREKGTKIRNSKCAS
jgi:hypothetical protein